MKNMITASLIAIGALASTTGAIAQEFKQPMKFVVPFAPGGATDVLARMVAPKISAELGQPIIIEKRAGASGQIGTQYVKNSPADGSTFLVNTDSSLTILPNIMADVPYSSSRDFMMVGKIATLPWALSVPAANNIKTLDQFIAYIQKDPKLGNYAVPTTGGVPQMIGEVIGKKAKNVSRADALNYVLGYTCANDVSARDWQKHGGGGQWCRGKSFDTFCPLGPVLVTTDEIPDPNSLAIKTVLNGETMQDWNTDDMIFDVPTLIEFLSGSTTLMPGTVILTGTPHGVGAVRTPPVFMRDGDVVSVEIAQIGTLTNPVKDEV